MRKYELMTIFPLEDEGSKVGLETLKNDLSEFGVEIEKEEVFGDRDLCYAIKKHKRGRYILMIVKANPAKITDLDRQFKLNPHLLKYLFVRIDE